MTGSPDDFRRPGERSNERAEGQLAKMILQGNGYQCTRGLHERGPWIGTGGGARGLLGIRPQKFYFRLALAPTGQGRRISNHNVAVSVNWGSFLYYLESIVGPLIV